uniref:Aspartate dehydrogenase domain-containing protein n=1 Tax=Panagrellus redivivus TaxID=6233 RepID=A0A7E4WCL6_PANRE
MVIKKIGIIGYGHLGEFLSVELKNRSTQYSVEKIWNRTPIENENVLPLTDLTEENLAGLDLVIEVAHPQIIHDYAELILKNTNLFIGSPTALAEETTLTAIKQQLKQHPERRVFVPAGAFWGASDIQKMADIGTLKGLTVTMIKHPNSLKVLGDLDKLCQRAKILNSPVVLYDGPVRHLCPLAPNNVNTMAGAAVAAHNLGFDNTRAKLIADPGMTNWHIVEVEVTGPSGFSVKTRRENPAAPGAVTGSATYMSFLTSIIQCFYKPPGINIC